MYLFLSGGWEPIMHSLNFFLLFLCWHLLKLQKSLSLFPTKNKQKKTTTRSRVWFVTPGDSCRLLPCSQLNVLPYRFAYLAFQELAVLCPKCAESLHTKCTHHHQFKQCSVEVVVLLFFFVVFVIFSPTYKRCGTFTRLKVPQPPKYLISRWSTTFLLHHQLCIMILTRLIKRFPTLNAKYSNGTQFKWLKSGFLLNPALRWKSSVSLRFHRALLRFLQSQCSNREGRTLWGQLSYLVAPVRITVQQPITSPGHRT